MAVKVTIHETWMNCPRYVHRFKKLESSRYAPGVEAETPFCEWKRIDRCRTLCGQQSARRSRRSARRPIDEWMGKVMSGDKGV